MDSPLVSAEQNHTVKPIENPQNPPQEDKPTPFSLVETILFLYRLFFTRKFIVHRLTGLSYLIQYAATFIMYIFYYETFKNSFLVWSLPLTGLIQSVTAIYTFTFLPKNAKDPGYYGDKGILSYSFIVENSFFELLLLFQWLYYNDFFFSILRMTILPEATIVFLPYIIRVFWPQTRFRDSLGNDKSKSDHYRSFYFIATWITKLFYIWAKHYIGFFLNYVRFLDRVDEKEKQAIYFVLIFGAFATTISLFLHTLRFKHYISPITSFLTYMSSYLGTFYGFYLVSNIFIKNIDLTLLVFLGMLINFGSRKVQYTYQVLLMVFFLQLQI